MSISLLYGSQQLPTRAQHACSRAQQRFSSFFHGQSVLKRARYGSPVLPSKPSYIGHPMGASEVVDLRQGARLPRSRASTRSLIDPISSPISIPGSPPSEELWHYRGAWFRPVPTLAPSPRYENSRGRHAAEPAVSRPERPSFPQHRSNKQRGLASSRDRRIKYKAIGSLVSGTLLALFLAIYLALAISKSAQGQTFHVLFILFILILAMIFCHFLIRLSMLSLHLRVRGNRPIERGLTTADEEECAQPETPIPVVLARDEELGLNGTGGEDESIRPIPHPPPAYGLWRSSVRADPDLIHWQRTNRSIRQCEGETPDLAQHPALRPPSYHSREHDASSSLYSASPVAMPQPLRFRF